MWVTLTWQGWVRAWRARRLIGLVWAIQASVAAAAALPFWWVLRDVLAPRPGADVLGSRLRLDVLADLSELRPGLIGAFGFTAVVVAAVGVVLGAAVAGGVLEVLGSADGGALAHRFGRGAGRFFGRFLRASLLVGAAAALTGGLAVLPFVYLTRQHFRASWDVGRLGPPGALATIGLVTILALLVLDATRIVLVRSDGRVLASLAEAGRLVLGHPVAWAGVWFLNAALVAGALALYASIRLATPAPTGLWLLLVVAAQQALVAVRTGLRIALFASEEALVGRLRAPVDARAVGAQPEPSSPSESLAVASSAKRPR